MTLNISAWKGDDPDWLSNRKDAWLEDGEPTVSLMYKLGGDLDAKTVEAIKDYFFTGKLDENTPIPFYYKIRFYPGTDDQYLNQCAEQSTDSELSRYVIIYYNFSMGIHDQSFAGILFSDWMEARLTEYDPGVVLNRDFNLVSKVVKRWGREMSGQSDEAVPHFYDYLEDQCLSIAVKVGGKSSEREAQFQSILHDLMDKVACFIEPTFLPNTNTDAKKRRDLLAEYFDTQLGNFSELSKYWYDAKKLKHVVVEVEGYDEEDLNRELVLCENSCISTPKFREVLEQFRQFLLITELTSTDDWVESFREIEIDGLFSKPASSYLKIGGEPLSAFQTGLKIDHPAIVASDQNLILPIHIFVIPSKGNGPEIEEAAILIWPENHPSLKTLTPPSHIVNLYHACIRWSRISSGIQLASIVHESVCSWASNNDIEQMESDGFLVKPWVIAKKGSNFLEIPASAVDQLSEGKISFRVPEVVER